MRSSVGLVVWAVWTITLSACNGSAVPTVDQYEISGEFAGIAVLSDETVVVGHRPDPAVAATLLRVELETGALSPLDLDVAAPCESPDYLRPSRLPDGRLGALVRCPQSGDTVVVAIDVADGDTQVLAELHTVPGEMAWSPSLDRALADFGSDICGSMAWISNGEIMPLQMSVEAGGRSFALDEAYRHMAGGDCREDGRAAWPSWSADDQLAFFASPASIGVEGLERLDMPWSLFIADPTEDSARAVIHDVVSPRGLSWSPDGSRLAFSGDTSAGSGTWLVDTQGDLTHVSDVSLDWLTWEPSGTAIIGLWRSGGPQSAELELVRIDLASIVER